MIRVQADDFDIGTEIEALIGDRSDVGAVVTFSGRVRLHDKGADLKSLTLEHYPGMTEDELNRIEADARSRWPLQASLIVHRYGELKPGDNIVLVVTASAHRQAAFEAATFLMDFLKTSAPFWKKAATADDEGTWVDATESDNLAVGRWTHG